jgi:hypothetical protein
MANRGRKSGASLDVVRSIGTVVRPDPMSGLTVDQSNEWIDVVNRMPADWFPRETHSILAQYCRHVVSAKRVDDLIESLIKGETESGNFLCDYDRLLKMQEREGRAMSSLATRMRLTQQSLVSKDRTKGGMKDKPPHMS